jgi:hypothetical protein
LRTGVDVLAVVVVVGPFNVVDVALAFAIVAVVVWDDVVGRGLPVVKERVVLARLGNVDVVDFAVEAVAGRV